MQLTTILPAEWHKQSFVQITFPHSDTDWQPYLKEAEECFLNIAREILTREDLLIVAPDVEIIKEKLKDKNVRYFQSQTNDTWARDHAGITIFRDGKPVILDFKFNGWGLKFPADKDNLITSQLFRHCGLDPQSQEKRDYQKIAGQARNPNCYQYENKLNFVLEGGSIESDGKGTLLTTAECLLSPNRNGEWNKQQIENYLIATFNLKRILWLNHGYLAGDDTDSHIDTLARFCPNDTIVYVKCEDENDKHFSELKKMEEELQSFKTLNGKPYRLLPLPMADAIYFEGERLPATYANFLIINAAVLYPTYNQPKNDEKVKAVLRKAFPDREVVGIDCTALIKQHGSLHCVTMQFPAL